MKNDRGEELQFTHDARLSKQIHFWFRSTSFERFCA